jgi:hypothetical protein
MIFDSPHALRCDESGADARLGQEKRWKSPLVPPLELFLASTVALSKATPAARAA